MLRWSFVAVLAVALAAFLLTGDRERVPVWLPAVLLLLGLVAVVRVLWAVVRETQKARPSAEADERAGVAGDAG